MFAFKPDYEEVFKRYMAWWEGEIVDRPLTSIAFMKPEEEQVPIPEKTYANPRDQWFDCEFRATQTLARMTNVAFYADALPVQFPNLGPEIFSAFFGCELEFSPHTVWSIPNLPDWSPENLATIRLDLDNVYFKKLMELTDAYLAVAKGRFIVGYTDLHSGGDAIAAFRDPQRLCMDMATCPDKVRALCDRITEDFLKVYDIFHEQLSAAGMPSTTWLPVISHGKCHIPSNDFSCMISNEQFEDVFIPGLERECAHMTHCMYHLDGPGALRFLDRLMEIPNLHAIQWVPGAGRADWHEWIEVYKRIQARGKSFVAYLPAGDVDEFMQYLRPEGAWLNVSGVSNADEADAILARIAQWA